MSKRKVPYYTETFRKEAVRKSEEPGMTAVIVARELGLNVNQIYNWRNQLKKYRGKQFNPEAGQNQAQQENARVRQLERQLAEVQEERDFLKKAAAYFAKVDE